MVLKREVVQRRLEELDWTLQRLSRHRDVDLDTYRSDPDLQWIVERGLLLAAGLVFDVADHVLSGHFGRHPETYQASLGGLYEEGVSSSEPPGTSEPRISEATAAMRSSTPSTRRFPSTSRAP